MAEIKIVTIVGARPQFVKAAAVSRAIRKFNARARVKRITEVLLHTGQHYDYNMSQVFFEQLEIGEPKYHLGVGSGTHGEMTGAMLAKVEQALMKETPDWVLVYGDTNSTLAGALAAAKLHIPVAHVEAGLRSFNRQMPEEINRILTDHLSGLLFCPTAAAVRNLGYEGITVGVHMVGDVMYDAFLFYKKLAAERSGILQDLGLRRGKYCLGTVHRQENTEDPQKLDNILAAFEALAREDCPMVLPLHPRTVKVIRMRRGDDIQIPNVKILPPVSYLDMIALETQARIILTDSGGIQKEAFFAKVPCITLRDETEWVETVEAGWNHLTGANEKSILKAFSAASESRLGKHTKLYGEGRASEHVLQDLILSSPAGAD
jgi:UDP-GlcNAc3NAcA epimerase